MAFAAIAGGRNNNQLQQNISFSPGLTGSIGHFVVNSSHYWRKGVGRVMSVGNPCAFLKNAVHLVLPLVYSSAKDYHKNDGIIKLAQSR